VKKYEESIKYNLEIGGRYLNNNLELNFAEIANMIETRRNN